MIISFLRFTDLIDWCLAVNVLDSSSVYLIASYQVRDFVLISLVLLCLGFQQSESRFGVAPYCINIIFMVAIFKFDFKRTLRLTR